MITSGYTRYCVKVGHSWNYSGQCTICGVFQRVAPKVHYVRCSNCYTDHPSDQMFKNFNASGGVNYTCYDAYTCDRRRLERTLVRDGYDFEPLFAPR